MSPAAIIRHLFVAIILLPAFAGAAQAADKKNNIGATKKIEPTKSATPLTEDECKSAGGGVGPYEDCNSGKVCMTTDQNHVNHAVCISVAK